MTDFSPALLDKCGSLLYRAWAEAFDNLKAVKAEKPDGSPDWDLFHADRLEHATTTEAHLKTLLAEITPHLPIVKNYGDLA